MSARQAERSLAHAAHRSNAARAASAEQQRLGQFGLSASREVQANRVLALIGSVGSVAQRTIERLAA